GHSGLGFRPCSHQESGRYPKYMTNKEDFDIHESGELAVDGGHGLARVSAAKASAPMDIVTTTAELEELCQALSRDSFIAVDTDVDRTVCGSRDQGGYEHTARKPAKAPIDKSSRFTDWSRRPLSENQLAYALSEVTPLRTVYGRLREKIERTAREPWLKEQM